MHKKLSKNKRDLNGLHKNIIITLSPSFSSYLKSTFSIDDVLPVTSTMVLYGFNYFLTQFKLRQLLLYVILYVYYYSLGHILQVLIRIHTQLWMCVLIYLHEFSKIHRKKFTRGSIFCNFYCMYCAWIFEGVMSYWTWW